MWDWLRASPYELSYEMHAWKFKIWGFEISFDFLKYAIIFWIAVSQNCVY
jgi:hypothetical protein